ncbi:hypothetical protein FRC00_004167 [Tulasnella sp. 408]|nr:hypothetical protein FRC00_004167 [Tulasnella sp. 408]
MSQSAASHPFVPDPIEYEHPKVVESLKQGWILTYQAIAVVAALFAGMEATLITLTKTAEPDSHPPLRWSTPRIQNTTLALAYVALVSSIGSIMSALKIIDGLGHMTFRNAIKNPESPLDWTRQRASYLMKPFGVAGNFRRLMYHCVGSLLVRGTVFSNAVRSGKDCNLDPSILGVPDGGMLEVIGINWSLNQHLKKLASLLEAIEVC